VFKSNPGFIFHDSRGFEAGGAQELHDVTTFLSARANTLELRDQVHAVWYCIPVDDDRPFTTAENKFFSECGTGSVPVIVIFTKCDAMNVKAYGELVEQGFSDDEARARAPDHAALMFYPDLLNILYGMKYPPKSHVFFGNMNQPGATCKELVDSTANGIYNDALKLLFVSTQRNNLALCMGTAMIEHKVSSTDTQAMQTAFMQWFPHTCVNKDDDNYLRKEDVMKPDIQSRLELLVADSEESSKAFSAAAVMIIILDLSFFIWDREPSRECFAQALSVYEKATSDHESVMSAVKDATRMQPRSKKEKDAFITKMKEIVLTHRLSDSYRAGTGTG